MKFSYEDGVLLETIVRAVHLCGQGGFGGMISAQHFSNHPFDAALIALAPIWKRIDFKRIEEFFSDWEDVLQRNDVSKNEARAYVKALQALVHEAMGNLPKINESVQDDISP